MGRVDPIRQQLAGAAPSGFHGCSSPKPEDVPLQVWLQENVGEQVAAWERVAVNREEIGAAGST